MTHIEGDTILQSDVLEDLADAVQYRRWLVELALPYLGDGPVLEIGSGTGDYAAEWAAHGVFLTVSEADPSRLAQLHSRFEGTSIAVRELAVPIVDTAENAAVIAYNVLEHIPDDVEALMGFRSLLAPGGRVVLIVPAFDFAMSRFDRAIGHQRRYTRATLSAVLGRAGFVVESVRYVNPAGLVAWLVMMTWLGRRPRSGPLLRTWDRWIVPPLRRLEGNRRPPFGQSVFAVARRA